MSQTTYSCDDFLGFQEALKKMRNIDDKIIYALNTSLPTESFKGQVDERQTCVDLYAKLQESHRNREEAIKSCIILSAETLKTLREAHEADPANISASKKFKSEQRKRKMCLRNWNSD